MKRFIAVALVTLVAVLVGVAVAQAQAAGKTIAGKVTDATCKPTDLVCMTAGAKAGHPLTLTAKDGKAYVLVGPFAANKNAKLVAFVGKSVQATGSLATAAGKLRLTVTAIK